SEQLFDPFARGILPAGSPFGGGTLLSDVSGNSNLLFRPALANANEVGEYDVADVFFEASAPLLVGRTFAEELTVDAAVRFADYSTIGDATTWKTSISYAPVSDIRFRATLSEAVRAPNITELFAPTTGITSRPNDPCDAAQINAIAADNPTLAAQTQANCVADLQAIGLDPFDGNGVYNFADPLSAAFGGVQSGNANLDEEVADTITVGFITQPRFLEGFTFSIDYWEISIEDAIASVSDQDIVNACYNGTSLNDAFCSLFTRNNDPNSLQFGGFNNIQRSLVNFARLDTRGFDFSADYKFNLGEHDFSVNVSGTKVHQLDRFSDPQDLSVVDVELGEVRRPEWAGNVFLNWFYNGWNVGVQSQYQGEQLLRFVEIDTAQSLYGDDVFQDAFWQHDLSVSFDYSDQLRIYGGIRNFTDEEPFITDFAYPASPRGRFMFIGANYLVE
ncbi:MAG: TonB-dependent receptor, partial [Pseudomonadota bacterium]